LSEKTSAGVDTSYSNSTAPHDQFDFIIGNWLVRDASGQAIGVATISKEYGGCVLVEKRHGVGKSHESLGVVGYRLASGTWHRDFIDDSGFVLSLDGGRDAAAMVMTGKDYRTEITRLHRVSWTHMSDGTIEERWQISSDGGTSWQEHFYAVFQRIAE